MNTVPNLITRKTNQIDLRIPIDPNVSKYRFSGHQSLDGAVAGTANMFEVPSGRHYISPGLKAKGLGAYYDTKRGMTRITFDPDDFSVLSADLPPDSGTLFLRVEDFDLAAGSYLPPGQILVLPPAVFFGLESAAITMAGTAPAGIIQAVASILVGPGPVLPGTILTIGGVPLTANLGVPRTPGLDNFDPTAAPLSTELTAAINDGANTFVPVCTAVDNNPIVSLTAVPAGVLGNAITLVTSDPANFVLSGPTFSGGETATAGATASSSALSFGLPKFSSQASITNNVLAVGENLLISFNEGVPTARILPGGNLFVEAGSLLEVLLISETGNPIQFSAVFTLTNT